MKITRDNYEEYFIDYLDGNLSDAQILEFEAFLLENPDLRDEIQGLEKIVIPSSNTIFPIKDNLKQIDITIPVTESNFDFFCIAEAEGDLTPEQLKVLKDYIKEHPEKEKERELILSLKIQPETAIVFGQKNRLKKSVFFIKRPVIYRTIAFAASLALLMVFYFNFIDKDLEQSFVTENTESLDAKDSTSVAPPKKKSENAENTEDVEMKQLIPAAKEKVKKAAKTISFKVGIPIASVEEADTVIQSSYVIQKELLSNVNIDPSAFRSYTPPYSLVSEQIDPSKIILTPVKKRANPQEYQSIDEFAITKFSELVFKEREKSITGWGLASAGVEKINDLTGANMKLEASAEEEGKPRKLSFNSRLLTFSTPINRED